MVQKIVNYTYKCAICGTSYSESHAAERCEESCNVKEAALKAKVKAGTYYFDATGNRIMRITMVRNGKVFFQYISGYHHGLHRGETSEHLSTDYLEKISKMEKMTEDQIPEKVDLIYQSMKDEFIANSLRGRS